MSCSVAIPSSPVFSPSRRPLSCKAASASASPESVSVSVSSPAPSTAGSPLRPFGLLRAQIREEASPSPKTSSAAPSAAAGSMLKRRRPAPLMVPVDGAAAAAAAAAAVAAVESDPSNEVEEEGDEFAAYCRRGRGRRRVEMEDRHVAQVALGGDPQVALFAVFDGHGGKNAAEFAAQNMPKFMAEEVRKVDGGDSDKIEGAVKKCYLKTDEEFLKREESGGACCVTALLQKGGLTVSNTGDCRAVLSRAGTAEALTSDHRASREDERERIENLGGFVVNNRGTWRVQGSLAVSRGIGDAHLKQWVVADPDTRTLLVDPQCEFLVLASDGLWDKVDNQEAIDIARPLCIGNDKASRMAACRRLVETAGSRGSTDDISVLIIQLQKFSGSS
ncbi:probable protein phosphatase 2C 32 [Triticum urartu]|uniref:protein-serine/threonine phosphatase n=1 Tax=Triticum urartu TaxID=4572 RepID=A0A8R7U7C9_TRIUA|nr:probable protein phosphatase 2C 32 [Triticum urartu]